MTIEAAVYASLFATSLAAATILPLSSEAVLTALTLVEGYEVWLLIAVASVGNTLGAVVNWWLGRYCLKWRGRRWFPVSERALERATDWFGRYGSFALLFAWVPVVGDPLTFAAGVLRTRFGLFLVLVGIGKTSRYVVVAMLAESFAG